MRRTLAPTLVAPACAVAATGAAAQAPADSAAGAPATKPARARTLIGIPGAYRLGTGRISFVGRRIRVHLVVSRYVPRQVVTVRFTRGRATVKQVRLRRHGTWSAQGRGDVQHSHALPPAR